MTDPLVSVLMIVYNGERYLEQSVHSVLAQDMPDFELVIVDDGSTDRTPTLLSRLASSDPRIVIHRHTNRGIPKSANAGLALCRGRYVARLDSDDVAKPERLRHQVAFMEANDVVCAGSWFDLIDARDRFLTVIEPPEDDAEIQRLALAGHGSICHPTCMIRREALDAIHGYDEHFDLATDLDLWLRLGEVGKLANMPLSLTRYRVHSGSVSAQRGRLQRDFARAACERAWKRRGIGGTFGAANLWRPGEDRRSQHAYSLEYGWWAFKSGERSTAVVYGGKAVAAKPWDKEGWRLLVCALMKKA